MIRSIQTPSVQVNSSELQELKTKDLIILSSFIYPKTTNSTKQTPKQPEGQGDGLVLSAASKVSANAPLVLSCDLFNHSDHLRMTTYQLPSLIHPSMRRLIFLGCSTPKYSTGTGFGRTGFLCISFLKSLSLV